MRGWSKPQVTRLHIASKLAAWNTEQRYMAMRHVGCPQSAPKSGGARRPSVKDTRNTQHQYEMLMSIAEGHWKQNGGSGSFPMPRNGGSWAKVACSSNQRMSELVRRIWAEARARLPEVFTEGGLEGFVARMTNHHDQSLAFETRPLRLEEVNDPATIYKILEGIKAWVGREFLARGWTPSTFKARWPSMAVGRATAIPGV